MGHKTWQEFAYELGHDLERFPLPICFDAVEERRELFRRYLYIQDVAKRFFKLYKL